MSHPILSQINIYPIKSTRGISLSSSWVDDLGLSFDRRFVLTDRNNTFITARKYPSLCLVQANLVTDGIILSAPNMPVLKINYHHFNHHYQSIDVWSDTIKGQHCNEIYDQWFEEYLGVPCKLFHYGEKSFRLVKDSTTNVAFADGYPLLLISQSSLNSLNHRSSIPHSMNQFRPNIVAEHCDAFAEDGWKKVRIGDVTFEITKPCARCIMTTIDPETGINKTQQEPLKTLKTFRKGSDGEIYFGQNLIALNQGKISIGDKVEILQRQSVSIYIDKRLSETDNSPKLSTPEKSVSLNSKTAETKTMSKKVNILFDSWNIDHRGNNKDSILDQGEEAGLIMPYSCRGGMCGRCKVKLKSGEVRQLTTDGLMPDEQKSGYILACSAIPKTDIVITKD